MEEENKNQEKNDQKEWEKKVGTQVDYKFNTRTWQIWEADQSVFLRKRLF